MTTTTARPTVPAEALDAIEALTDAADTFVTALTHAADQDTLHPGYWAGYVAQVKHVVEHGAAAMDAALIGPLSLYGTDRQPAARVRVRALSEAGLELKGAAEMLSGMVAMLGLDDAEVLERDARRTT